MKIPAEVIHSKQMMFDNTFIIDGKSMVKKSKRSEVYMFFHTVKSTVSKDTKSLKPEVKC